MEIFPRIEVKEEIKGGIPVIKGTRIPVDLVLSALAGGMSIEEVMKEYDLQKEDILAAIAFAAERIKEERYRLVA